ncbi:MAG: hypothetical protein SFV15_15100 [Polyangiaceae bacterium]|nr:hypothetical protein [Polyangiaceae bacterium]
MKRTWAVSMLAIGLLANCAGKFSDPGEEQAMPGTGGSSATGRGSGVGGTSGTGGTGMSGGVPADFCSRFGLRFAPTCDACPVDPITCPCSVDGAFEGLFPNYLRCNFGQCLLSMDCTEICRAVDAVFSPSPVPPSPDLLDDITRFPACVRERPCQFDSGCGVNGKCVGESETQLGTCTAGDALCKGASDCWSGICVVRASSSGAGGSGGAATGEGGSGALGAGAMTSTGSPSGDGICSDGMPGSYCSADSHCPGGKCLVGFNSICTRGNAEDPCRGANDCVSGTFCVRAPSGPDAEFGACRAGNTDDPCGEDAECKSGACVYGTCGTGENRSSCFKPTQCRGGFCARTPGSGDNDAGSCDSGDSGALCALNSDCKSAHCAVRVSDQFLGICTDGKSGDPCVLGTDCSSQVCTVPRPHDSQPGCVSGGPCGLGGTCDGNLECQYGRCK